MSDSRPPPVDTPVNSPAAVPPAAPLSKTRLKRDAQELQALGTRLVELPRERLQKLDLPERLREAVRDAQSMTRHEAKRRQMQYIGKLMRDIDPAAIRAQLGIWDGNSASEIARQHSIERWRVQLLASDAALTEFAARYPGCDTTQLRTLVRNAHREAAQGKPARSYRELFRVLRTITNEPRPDLSPDPQPDLPDDIAGAASARDGQEEDGARSGSGAPSATRS
ncbi:MAG: DUF615 domain-containing protein [Proteobacteria bacterium]|nr:DUF615 domain-containing protein [Burkholderiales bacterium]